MSARDCKRQLEQLEAVASGDVLLLEDEPMHRHTSFRIGGPAALMAVVRRNPVQSARALLEAACALGVRPFFMGNGTDLLVPDDGYRGLIVKTTADSVTRDGARITAEAGILMGRLANVAQGHGLTGLEFAHGIPGSLGGGLVMNAGAYDGELCGVVSSVTCLDRGGGLHTLDNAACAFGYRSSAFSGGGYYIASATLSLSPGDPAVIRARMDELAQKRRARQPLEYPSAGSAFKRPKGHFAAALIEQCGLKGLTVGGAQVSEKHTGFIINRGGATCRDVLELMDKTRGEVLRQTGVALEPEIHMLECEGEWIL